MSEDQLRESTKQVFLDKYHESDPEAKLGSGGCNREEGKAYDFDCELGVEVALGATDPWGYAVKVGQDGCWRGRLFQPYGPYTSDIEDPGFEDSPESQARNKRIATAMREIQGCVDGANR